MTTKLMSLREAFFVLCLEAISSRKQDGLSAMEGIPTLQEEHLRLAQQKNPRNKCGTDAWSDGPGE